MVSNVCPNCQGTIDPFGKCEYCGKVVNSQRFTNNDTGDSTLTFAVVIKQLQNKIRELKTYPTPSLIENIFHSFFNILTLGLYSMIKKRVVRSISFDSHVAEIVELIRTAKAFYGGNTEAAKLITELEQEFNLTKLKYEAKKKKANIGCLIIAVIIFLLFLIVVRSASDFDDTPLENESGFDNIEEIQNNTSENKFVEARSLANKLGLDDKKEMLRKIQFAEIEFRISTIKTLSANGILNKAEEGYNDLNWIPIDNPKFDYKEIEATKRFTAMKESLRKYLDSNKQNN